MNCFHINRDYLCLGSLLFLHSKQSSIQKKSVLTEELVMVFIFVQIKKKILSMPHYCEGNRKQKKKLVGISEVMHKCSPFPSLQESFG